MLVERPFRQVFPSADSCVGFAGRAVSWGISLLWESVNPMIFG